MSYAKIGDLLARQKQRREALDYFEKALAISTRLTRHDPTNAVWKNDLAWLERRIAQLNAVK